MAFIVKRHAGHVGFAAEEFSGHSLRAGLATSAAEAGQNEREIMNQTRHKSEKMVRRYIRKGRSSRETLLGSWDFDRSSRSPIRRSGFHLFQMSLVYINALTILKVLV